jgi:hypothetical protein
MIIIAAKLQNNLLMTRLSTIICCKLNSLIYFSNAKSFPTSECMMQQEINFLEWRAILTGVIELD